MLPLMMLGMGKKKKKSQRGSGFSIPKVSIGTALDAGNFAKKMIVDKKLISKGLGLIDHPIAQGASYLAGQLGLGKKKRKSKQKGGHKLFGQVGPESTFGNGITPFVGMGKRKRKQHGRGIFSDLGGGIGAATYGLGSGLGNFSHGLFGGGKHHNRHIKM
jgi:hypothetical protein